MVAKLVKNGRRVRGKKKKITLFLVGKIHWLKVSFIRMENRKEASLERE